MELKYGNYVRIKTFKNLYGKVIGKYDEDLYKIRIEKYILVLHPKDLELVEDILLESI